MGKVSGLPRLPPARSCIWQGAEYLGSTGANPGTPVVPPCSKQNAETQMSLPRGGRRSFRDFPLPGAPLLVGCGAYLGSILLPIRGGSVCGHVRGLRACKGGRTHGEGVQDSRDSPLPIVHLAGCGATWVVPAPILGRPSGRLCQSARAVTLGSPCVQSREVGCERVLHPPLLQGEVAWLGGSVGEGE